VEHANIVGGVVLKIDRVGSRHSDYLLATDAGQVSLVPADRRSRHHQRRHLGRRIRLVVDSQAAAEVLDVVPVAGGILDAAVHSTLRSARRRYVW
jgi:hypothetical protein